jgi:aminopeptidase N
VDEQGGLGKLGGGGTGDEFVFHELAHQWWGHQIGVVGPEDIWIAESFAEYSSGMMIAAIDPKRFDLLHKKWKQHAIEHDPYGTINAAYRSDTREHPDTYYYMVYYKGPCVLHMLRTWMGWEKFSQFLSAVQTKYKGTNINTDTLAREASKTMGYDMFPFFDQWVRDKGIPKVHYSWSAAADAEGKQVITIKTRQEDDANPKIMMVPIGLDFGKGPPTTVLKPILKAQTDIQLRVPALPKSVILDPDDTQLAVFIPDQK